jgi:hypothetical protein
MDKEEMYAWKYNYEETLEEAMFHMKLKEIKSTI